MKSIQYESKIYIQRKIVSACSFAASFFILLSLFGSVFADPIQPAHHISNQNRLVGSYLARVGNCIGCHTARGGDLFAGGREMHTSFGIFITPNITPDKETGIGNWDKSDFWRALHQGESRNGRMLYPVFPYPQYTKITRKDSDAIFDYLMSLKPIVNENAPSRVFFPYNLEPLLYIWRKLYFKKGVFKPDLSKSKEWNRGAYLVEGLGHCNSCHSSRNLLGASQKTKHIGKKMTGMGWYAPSLISRLEAGSRGLEINEIIELLTSGISKNAVASGHMATVIRQSLQFMLPQDIRAIAIYLKYIGRENSDIAPAESFPVLSKKVRSQLSEGGKIYTKYCEGCHQSSGRGIPGIYPPLAGNRSVTMSSPLNTILSVMHGGFPPTTIGNPRPYGMPPFQQIFHDKEIALVVSYIRNAWGNHSSLVTEIDIERSRNSNRD
ncbi:MAG: alcohol dehydrogenase [Nitrosomonadaceae bacterium]|nr:alcohol dehydrogenase [Nitrosomonadaceae bacterium]|tara:strand:+ start:1568 stop:2878 length:1311 start_codon:yes stop_codon:yes gene_type:complete